MTAREGASKVAHARKSTEQQKGRGAPRPFCLHILLLMMVSEPAGLHFCALQSMARILLGT